VLIHLQKITSNGTRKRRRDGDVDEDGDSDGDGDDDGGDNTTIKYHTEEEKG
jgi:hypothetical protein